MRLQEYISEQGTPLIQGTLIFLREDDRILLAMKKRGFGQGNFNGVGGKVEVGETVKEAAVREAQEEIGVQVTAMKKAADLAFYFLHEKAWNMRVEVFIAHAWVGKPQETEEMAPQWFDLTTIPYAHMWSDDILWLPHVLAGKKVVADFLFTTNQQVEEYSIQVKE